MRITLDTDTSDCPGAVCKIVADDGRDILVQQDWDAPGIARTFGWNIGDIVGTIPTCRHPHTDGTVDCPDCHLKAGVFIHDARHWLDVHDGESVDNPGYFDGE